MFKEFKAFIARGNVMDLAVAVIIGAAFGKIVTSLTEDIISRFIGWIFGGADFTRYFVILHVPANYAGSMGDYAALKKAGAAVIGYGAFLTAIINFLILAFVIFMLVRYTHKVMAGIPSTSPTSAKPAGPSETDLLTEIRDS